jgi:ubiquitin carboxyl-terminal hydrolase 4/11/15
MEDENLTNGSFRGSSYRVVHKNAVKSTMQNHTKQGIVGLKNLGNTCFMNSSLQCLANTVPLVDYFLGYNWNEEINCENPLGTGGVIAEEFGNLMSQMWSASEGCKPIVPKSFKGAISQFQSQFHGNNQHDAHELLSFLVDGLHEDLNRVVKSSSQTQHVQPPTTEEEQQKQKNEEEGKDDDDTKDDGLAATAA